MMGTLRSKTYATGITINGVQLGQPVIQTATGPADPGDTIPDLWFCWDDDAYPNGIINSDGTITPDA